jgi:hypothetical protein
MITGKKCISLLLVVLFLFLVFIQWSKPGQAQSDLSQVNQFAHVLQQKGLTLSEWSIYARETVQQSNKSFKEVELELENKLPDFSWSNEKDGLKIVGTKRIGNFKERVVATTDSPILKQDGEVYILYQLIGNNWSVKIEKQASSVITKSMSQIFNENPKIFTCVKGTMGDTLESVLQGMKSDLLKTFHATEIEQIKEGAFISVSAYTKQWNDALSVNNKQVNFQMAIRENDVDHLTTITLGSPIITVEY